MEAADAAAIRDGRAIEAGGEQLQERHDPVLPSGHPGDQIVGCAEFVGIIAMNTAHPAHNRASRPPERAPRPFCHTSMRSSSQTAAP